MHPLIDKNNFTSKLLQKLRTKILTKFEVVLLTCKEIFRTCEAFKDFQRKTYFFVQQQIVPLGELGGRGLFHFWFKKCKKLKDGGILSRTCTIQEKHISSAVSRILRYRYKIDSQTSSYYYMRITTNNKLLFVQLNHNYCDKN